MAFQILGQELHVIFRVKLFELNLLALYIDVMCKHLFDSFVSDQGFGVPAKLCYNEVNVFLRVLRVDRKRGAYIN